MWLRTRLSHEINPELERRRLDQFRELTHEPGRVVPHYGICKAAECNPFNVLKLSQAGMPEDGLISEYRS